MGLYDILADLRTYPGLTRKARIADWALRFRAGNEGEARSFYGPGDDAGAVEVDGGYLLLSAEAIRSDLLADPYFAGFCAVTVNVNDIFAMGGRPLGLVQVVLSGGFTDSCREEFLAGLQAGLSHYRVPLLGGHTSPEGSSPAVAIAIAGFARRLMRGDGARPGDRLVAALDLAGRAHEVFHAWDTVTGAEGDRTVSRLEALAELGERGLCSACRDISNPGLLGTLAMMLEASGAGARVNLDRLPVPVGVDLCWWLKTYPSFGFLLAVPEENFEAAAGVLKGAGVEGEEIGVVTGGSAVEVELDGESGLFLDLGETGVTGLF